MIVFISAGAIQLLVGPESGSSTEQMKVRSSTRATSTGVGCAVERVGLLLRVEPGERAGLDELVGEGRPFLLRAGAPVDAVGLGQLGDLLDPGQQPGMRGRRVRLVGVAGDDGVRPPRQSRSASSCWWAQWSSSTGSLLTLRGGSPPAAALCAGMMGIWASHDLISWDVPATVRRIDGGARPERCEEAHKGCEFVRADNFLAR